MDTLPLTQLIEMTPVDASAGIATGLYQSIRSPQVVSVQDFPEVLEQLSAFEHEEPLPQLPIQTVFTRQIPDVLITDTLAIRQENNVPVQRPVIQVNPALSGMVSDSATIVQTESYQSISHSDITPALEPGRALSQMPLPVSLQGSSDLAPADRDVSTLLSRLSVKSPSQDAGQQISEQVRPFNPNTPPRAFLFAGQSAQVEEVTFEPIKTAQSATSVATEFLSVPISTVASNELPNTEQRAPFLIAGSNQTSRPDVIRTSARFDLFVQDDGRVSHQAVQLLRMTDQVIELKLDQSELGRLSLSLALKDDAISLQVITPSQATRDLLLQHGERLRYALVSSGMELGQLAVDIGKEQQSGKQSKPPLLFGMTEELTESSGFDMPATVYSPTSKHLLDRFI